MQANTNFPKVRRMLIFLAPLHLILFWPATTRLRGHLTLSTRLRWWGSPGQTNPSEGFWSRFLVWRAIAFENFTRWIGPCMSVPFRRIDFGGFMSWITQPNCRALDDRRPVGPRVNSWLRFLSGRPDLSWLLSRLTTGCRTFSCQSFFFNIATALLSSFFLDLLLGCSSTWRCAYEHFSPKRQPLLVL